MERAGQGVSGDGVDGSATYWTLGMGKYERALAMLTGPDLDLGEAYLDSDPRARVRPAFPINCFTGAEHTAVVYFE